MSSDRIPNPRRDDGSALAAAPPGGASVGGALRDDRGALGADAFAVIDVFVVLVVFGAPAALGLFGPAVALEVFGAAVALGAFETSAVFGFAVRFVVEGGVAGDSSVFLARVFRGRGWASPSP